MYFNMFLHCDIFYCCIGFLVIGVKAPVPYHPRDLIDNRITRSRSGPFLPGYVIPGLKRGKFPQTVPGFALPGQTQNFNGYVPFNPLTQLVGTSAVIDRSDSWGYGIGIHGVNLLNLDVKRLYPLYVNNQQQRTDGRWHPFTFGLGLGSEVDFSKKWKSIGGKLDIPIPVLNEVFDISGNVVQKFGFAGLTKAALDFPIVGTPFRFPLDGELGSLTDDFQLQWGHVLPNVNQFAVPTSSIVNQLRYGREPNPTYFGSVPRK